MKNNNQVEVVLFSSYSFRDLRQRALLRWLGTTAQTAIGRQQQLVKKLFLSTLKDSPAIYLS